MRPLFTIHAGEFVVGDYIERTFRRVNLWVPSRDTGTDLLVTDSKNKKAVSLQVKFSRDFLTTHMSTIFQKPLRACGWWTVNREKLANSEADYWVFVLVGVERRSTDFVIIKPSVLLTRLNAIHKQQKKHSDLSLGDGKEPLLGNSRPEISRQIGNRGRWLREQGARPD